MAAENLFARIFSPERDERAAVLCEQREITYAALRELTVAAAEQLNSLNVKPDDRVAILLNDSPEFIASFVAIISLGSIAVPINMALRQPEQLFILKDCGARVAIVEAQAAANLFGNESAATQPAELQRLLVVRRKGDDAPSVPNISAEMFGQTSRQPISSDFSMRTREDADAFILYTSGSTGEPKGAVHTQSDIFYTNETYCREVLRLREGDRLFSSSRLPFAYGLGNAFTFALLNGLTTILCREKPTPEVVARVFQDYRPTIFFAVPVVFAGLAAQLVNKLKDAGWFQAFGRFAAAAAVGLLGVTLIALARPVLELHGPLLLGAVVVFVAALRGIHPIVLVAAATVLGAAVSLIG